MQPVPEGVYRHKINREKPTHDTKGDNMENNKEKRIIFATGNAGKMREIRADRKSTRLNSSHRSQSRMPSSA